MTENLPTGPPDRSGEGPPPKLFPSLEKVGEGLGNLLSLRWLSHLGADRLTRAQRVNVMFDVIMAGLTGWSMWVVDATFAQGAFFFVCALAVILLCMSKTIF